MGVAKNKERFRIPGEAANVVKTLKNKGFQAYLIGGCTRDLLLGRTPKDWDVTTDARPEEIIKIFPNTFYENAYGTVGVVNEESPDESLRVIEVTPYRLEATYSDYRRPDSVSFSDKLEDDLKRRDFTINAIALDIGGEEDREFYEGRLVDPYKGQNDLRGALVRTVGNPHERFSEDALRMLRAIRIATELGFMIDSDTEKAIEKYGNLLGNIAKERIRDEFVRILNSDRPMIGLELARRLGLLKYIAAELEQGVGTAQNQAHAYDVWEHSLRSLQHAADKKWPLEIRLAALLHDIGKPASRRWSDEKKDWTFYGHDVIGAKLAAKILSRLAFPKKTTETISKLVRWHMFFSDTEVITLSAVRRLLANVGTEHIWDLMNLRICDRIGTGRPKESPYRLRKYQSMIEEVMHDPVSVSMLRVNGADVISLTESSPGPKIGHILHTLLGEVIEDPKKNERSYLEKRVRELGKLSDQELE
ncbi:HD domain-containing protein, partial [Patescibacteria group bacterium]|nr:HD domain-containing protein [Patescibacteria group bacterium]